MFNATILYVEDDPANSRLVIKQLQHSGYTVHIARTGKEGVYLAESLRPHVILLDINLPDFDGVQIAQILRGRPTTSEIPIIAITSSTDPQDREDAMKVGCDMYLNKPVSKVELLKAIKTFVAYVNPAGTGA